MNHSLENTLLSTEDLSVGYKDGSLKNILFENLTASLYPGQLVCFMGSNGIGKSTLLRTIAGIQNPISGKINILNSSSRETDSHKISVVLTDKISSINMSVQELIEYGRYPYLDWNIKFSKKDKEIVNRVVNQCHIENLLDKKLFELSDGQLQMTMIARALAQDTPVILLDEPTAHLDLNNRVEIMNLLREICRTEEKAILVATHELDLALQTADLIWLAGRDKKIVTGMPEDLVLNGTFDDVFQFKGFDLKTGKVSHQPFRNKSVSVIGEGSEFLWTKNALERSGYKIDSASKLLIQIIMKEDKISWSINEIVFHSLSDVLSHLDD